MDKQTLRRSRWQALRDCGAARFPGAVGRIPNFTGAEKAAEVLAGQVFWRRAGVLKCNPDLPQRPVRYRALIEGKVLYLAVPRLADKKPFVRVDPRQLDPKELWKASSIAGAFALGERVGPDELPPIDLIVSGSVAVSADGSRLGKGGGFADLEYALLRENGRIRSPTPVVSTAHPTQVVRSGVIPMERHDVCLDGFATPERYVKTRGRRPIRPRGILWDLLDDEQRDAIPALRGVLRARAARIARAAEDDAADEARARRTAQRTRRKA